MSRRRHVPQRTCIGCGAVRPKRELVRLVRTPAGPVELDPTGKLSGRGAYVCPQAQCVEQALAAGRLLKQLKTTKDMVDLAALRNQLLQLVEESGGD